MRDPVYGSFQKDSKGAPSYDRKKSSSGCCRSSCCENLEANEALMAACGVVMISTTIAMCLMPIGMSITWTAPPPTGPYSPTTPNFPPPPVAPVPSSPHGPNGPLSTLKPVDDLGFYAVQRVGTALPQKKLWGEITTPYPTHEFYENIILGTGTEPENVIKALPYIYSVQGDKLSAIYPFVTDSEAQVQSIFDGVMGTLSLGGHGMGEQRVLRTDKASVTVGWTTAAGASTMQATIVQGDPYMSMQYDNAQVIISSPQMLTHLKFDNVKVKLPCQSGTTYAAHKIELGVLQHDALWYGYAFPPLTMKCGQGGTLGLLSTSTSYSGVVRLAMARNCTHGSGMHCGKKGTGSPAPPGWEQLLDKYASSRIVSGAPEFDIDDDGTTVTMNLKYDIQGLGGAPNKLEALLCVLPHHRDGNTGYIDRTILHRTMLGPMTPYVTQDNALKVRMSGPGIVWKPDNDIAVTYVNDIRKAVQKDAMGFKMPYNYQIGAGDPYNAGKLLSRVARVILIADHLKMEDEKDFMLGKLANWTSIWLTGKSANQLVYDKNWGGIVSCGCMYNDCGGKCKPHCDNGGPPTCPSLAEGSFAAGMDFGNGYYNDHHFHYGYILYAAAVIAKFIPEWGKQYIEYIKLLVRDVANPSATDGSFPVYRHMDFFNGHSWAGGIFQPFLNGRNQESVSEAVNCWYAVSLVGDALGSDKIRNIGLGLLAMESHAAHHYWQLDRSHSDTLPKGFAINGVSGILWSNLIQYQTWFGSTTWELNGIQMLPFTPVSEFLLRPSWVGQQIKDFQSSCTGQCVSDGWVSLVCMAQAVVDMQGAWECAQKLSNDVYDPMTAEGNGNSRSNLLYWIATRPPQGP